MHNCRSAWPCPWIKLGAITGITRRDHRNNPEPVPSVNCVTLSRRANGITRVIRDLRQLPRLTTLRTVLRDHRAQAVGDHGVAVLCCVLIDERSA